VDDLALPSRSSLTHADESVVEITAHQVMRVLGGVVASVLDFPPRGQRLKYRAEIWLEISWASAPLANLPITRTPTVHRPQGFR